MWRKGRDSGMTLQKAGGGRVCGGQGAEEVGAASWRVAAGTRQQQEPFPSRPAVPDFVS